MKVKRRNGIAATATHRAVVPARAVQPAYDLGSKPAAGI